jgi:glycosyltransferase involved in cell wall biosynthesis
METICIGVHVHAEPQRLQATLDSLRSNTRQTFDLLLLPDGPDDATKAALNILHNLQQSGTPDPLGPPACFNRLVSSTTAEVVIFLESGALVGPNWLEYLLAALASDPRNGLAGPSTNRSWNEQAVFPRSGGTPAEIANTAQQAAQQFGNKTKTLEPLYSLGDFCYVVRREVIQTIGMADESYGPGPCWEMDYNIRAARAGFRGVWACGAYVYRAPYTARRQREERLRFETSKHLYQDRFCALRLRGEQTSYKSHCRGDECEHFAPQGLIQVTLYPGLRRDLPHQFSTYMVGSGNSLDISTGEEAVGSNFPSKHLEQREHTTIGPQLTPAARSTSDLPLVSCIMPTRNRRSFVRQALIYFDRQDYPNRELIIVDDGNDRVSDLIPPGSHVNYIALSQRTSIGAKRNIACEQARGTVIAHWDDDDWYAPHRLQHQVTPLLDKRADITGLETSCFFDLTCWQAWTCTPDLHRRLFVGDVHGGTLVYWRWVWERLARYPEASLAEDAFFLRQACLRGARLDKLPHANSFVYLRHSSNAWHFPLGYYLQPAGWKRADLNLFLPPADLPFYAALSPAKPSLIHSSSSSSGKNDPLVSCIMPTYDRRAFVKRAISYFLRQDYAHKELIIVDDGTDAVSDLIPIKERIRYIRLREKATIGAKRNLACEQARGTIIAHWDDDDWYAPRRLRYQVEALLHEGTDICGISTLLYYDAENGRAWQYVYPSARQAWVAGSTLCYMRSFWASNRFANINISEDALFVRAARSGRVTRLPDVRFYVGMVHSHNVSPKKTNESYWQTYPVDAIQQLLGTDWHLYHPHQVAQRHPDLRRHTLPGTEINLSVNQR